MGAQVASNRSVRTDAESGSNEVRKPTAWTHDRSVSAHVIIINTLINMPSVIKAVINQSTRQ